MRVILKSKRNQKGALMLEMSLALLISALAAVGTMQERTRVDIMRNSDIEADSLGIYRTALQQYTDDAYQEIQSNTNPITRQGVTLQPGSALGQTMQPTVAQLIGMGYLTAGFTNTTTMVDGGSFQNLIQRLPVGCVTVACNVQGMAWGNTPYFIKGTNEMNGPVIGQMLSRLGGVAGVSMPGSSANITGAGAAWTMPNPVAGAPAAVVGALFGYSSATLLSYVRIGDLRDPSLAGNLTVAGNSAVGGTLNVTGATTLSTLNTTGAVTIGGATNINSTLNVTSTINAGADIRSTTNVGTTDGIAACLRAALTSAGNIISRSAACLDRITLDPNAGTVVMRDNANVSRVNVAADTGSLALFNAGAGQTVSLDSTSGRVQGNVGNFATTATGGNPCAGFNPGDIAQDVAASGTLLVCRGGFWRRTGLEQAVAGDVCPTTGGLAQTATNQGLICRGGTWQLLNDRVSPSVTMALWSGNGSAAVPAPVCGAGGTPDIAVAPLHSGADYGGVPPRNRFEMHVTGVGPWNLDPMLVASDGTAYLAGFTGTPYNFGWTATTYCQYPA